MTDECGEVVWANYEFAWGGSYQSYYREQVLNGTIIDKDLLQPLKFQGQSLDIETGLHYNRFRYYDSDVGMFIQRDPIGLLGGTNIFQYVDNPTFFIDPFGLRKTPHKVPSLDGKSGVYILTNPTLNEAYVGSGIDAGNRLGNNKHTKAQALLGHSDTKVEFVEVNLGNATSKRAKGNILRRFEQIEYEKVIKKKYNMKNSNNPEAKKKKARNEGLVNQHGASAKPKTSNHSIQKGCTV